MSSFLRESISLSRFVIANTRPARSFQESEETIHAGFPDPSAGEEPSRGQIIRFREVRDAITSWIDQTFVPGYGQLRIRQ